MTDTPEGNNGRGNEHGREDSHGEPLGDRETRNVLLSPEATRQLADGGRQIFPAKTGPKNPSRFLLWATVVVGAMAVLLESTAHILAGIYADPLPHYGYLFAYILAIAAPIWVNSVLKNPAPPVFHLGFAVAGNALSLLIAGMMMLALLPVAPFAVILSFVGIGLLGLSPYFVFCLSLYQCRRLQAQMR